jgi:hypothetical protein
MKAKDFKELDFSPWETDCVFDIIINKKKIRGNILGCPMRCIKD